ncbi:hypothetical protein M422DRAFT_255430 [Sphaerobolus stellatus SS14]|uniref:Uncharacterized protein n=1 Tax=Sphaerobolus stellatus (strain SS14) TaxID=990650 RepID=A0A0C9VIZ7_SPHS4|nr:hypothetical protein M422DRAFT_255430 [Sphaerobolus stellatus SS14]
MSSAHDSRMPRRAQAGGDASTSTNALPSPTSTPPLNQPRPFAMLIVRKTLMKKKQRLAPLDGDTWTFDAMTIAKNMASVSKLAPVAGPYIEVGANLFYNVLELLKVHPLHIRSH